jgi:hypothetical protein
MSQPQAPKAPKPKAPKPKAPKPKAQEKHSAILFDLCVS